jgi:hypothetical protein
MVPRCTGLKPQRAFSEPLCVALGLVTNWGNACCLGKAHDRHNQPNTDLRSPCDGGHRSTRPCVHRANPPSPCRLKRAGSEKRHGRRGFADPIAATQPAPATADSPAGLRTGSAGPSIQQPRSIDHRGFAKSAACQMKHLDITRGGGFSSPGMGVGVYLKAKSIT